MNQPEPELPEGETENLQVAATDDAPYVGKLVQAADESGGDLTVGSPPNSGTSTRAGSPFRGGADSAAQGNPFKTQAIEAAYGEFGPFVYTAMGGSIAAVVVLAFSALGAFWFPAGGALVAILGIVLSVIGMFGTKRFRYAAIAVAPIHMGLFLLSYVRSIG